MSYFCKELNKTFDTKAEMFAEIKANKDRIVGIKKAAYKDTDWVCLSRKGGETTKAEAQTVKIGDYVYPIINTTNYYDSHGDVHLDGIWDLSVKDQRNKLYYVINHDLEIGKVIAYPEDVLAYVETLSWSDLGLPYIGTTQALIYKVLLTEAGNKDAINGIIGKKPFQNSVRMGYIDMILCIDDPSPDFAQEYANFHKYLPIIANKEEVIASGIYWAISQGKIVKEGSAVLYGSNDATPILYSDPASTSQKVRTPNPQDSSTVKINKSHLNLI